MDNYKYAVEHLARNKINMEFDNEGYAHASAVLKSMFDNAEDHIKIFSGTLNGDVANDASFVKSFNKYIESKKKLRVILETIPTDKSAYSKALKRVLELGNNPAYNVKYKLANEEFIKLLRQRFLSGNSYHFAVSDDRSYRIELDAEKYKAICNFNDPKIAKKLENVFDSYFISEE